MKTLKSSLGTAVALSILFTNSPAAWSAAAIAARAGGTVRQVPAMPIPAGLGQGISNTKSPALNGGALSFTLPTLQAPQAAIGTPGVSPSLTPSVSLAPSVLPKAIANPSVVQAKGKVSVLQSVSKFATQIAPQNGKQAGPAGVSQKSRNFFDGNGSKRRGMTEGAVSADGGSGSVGSNSLQPARKAYMGAPESNGVPQGVTFQAMENGEDIATFKPRVVLLTDIFDKPASKETVAELQRLIDSGSHLVFMTWRGETGRSSAKSVLLSKLKARKDNPIIVVSENGSRISSYVSGEKSTSLHAAVSFTSSELETLSAINGRISKAMKLGPLGAPAAKKPLVGKGYTVTLPKSVPAGQLAEARSSLLKRYNSALRSAGLPYRMAANPDRAREIIIHSQPLRFALNSLSDALEQVFPGEELRTRGDEFLLLADTKKWSKLPAVLREEGMFASKAEIQHIGSQEDLQVLTAGAAAGSSEAAPQEVDYYKVRQFADWWLPGAKFRESGVRSSRKKAGGPNRPIDQKFALYSAKIINKVVTTLYDRSRRGKSTKLSQLEGMLDAMWDDPQGNGVWIDKSMAKAMKTATWAKLSPGNKISARSFIRGIWFREFGDFPVAQGNIMENQIVLASKRSAVNMVLRSPFTGKAYKMSANPQRVMQLDSAQGRVLTAYAIRTGKAQIPGPGDEFQAKVLALATLIGYGRKGTDQIWHHGTPLGAPLARIDVQFEYKRKAESWSFTPAQLLEILDDGRIKQGEVADEIVRLIEQAESDHAFQKDYSKKNRPSKKGAKEAPAPADLETLRAVQEFFGKTDFGTRTKPFKSDVRVQVKAAPRARKQRALLDKMGIKDKVAAQIDEADLSTHYPRVVVIQDTFDGPVPDQAAAYVQKLVDAGVRVVFMTRRSQQGPDSAWEILLSRVKTGRTNPVIVVSHNGGRVALHSKAANPKAILPDAKAFTQDDIKAFGAMAKALAKELGLKDAPEAEAFPGTDSAFAYSLSLPAAKRAAFLQGFNEALKEAGYVYAMEPVPGDRQTIRMYTQPMRFSISRVREALEATFAGENLSAEPEKWLILADSQRSPKFSKAFPKGTEVAVMKTGADLERTLGAVLGDRRLDTVSLKLGMLRQFVEYWEPMQERKKGKSSAAGGASPYKGNEEWELDKTFAKFTGSIFYKMMPWIFENIWRGQHQHTQLTALEAKLSDLWYHPQKNMVFISKAEVAQMAKAGPKARREAFFAARAYLRKIWTREFSDYSEAALNIMENLVSLSSDRQSLITLPFKSKTTGKLYKIFTRVPVLTKHDTPKGRVLTVQAFRTGQEEPNDGDVFHAKILAMATLVAYGRKGLDGTWRHGWFLGKPIHKIHVRLEFKGAPRDLWFDPTELLTLQENGKVSQGPIVQEMISVIERMYADPGYLEYWKEQEAAAKEARIEAKKREAAAEQAGGRKGGAK